MDLDPLPDFSPPRTLDDKPCLRGNVYLHCVSSCQFLAHDGTLKPGCLFYPRSLKAGETRTKEQYDKPKARRTGEALDGFQVWEVEQG